MSSETFVTVFDSRASQSFYRYLKNNFVEVYRFRHALANFVVNNLRMRYRRSVLGFFWSLLNPLLVMTVISIVFSLIFKQNIKTFSVYIFSGLAPWQYLNSSILAGCQTIINAEGFLKKVYIPKSLFPIITVTTETANFFFSIVSLFFLGIILGFRVPWTIAFLPLAILVTFIFNLGWALLLGVITVYFRDLTQIVIVGLQALFYITPIIYPIESIPAQFHILFYINPFYYFIILFRKIIYGTPSLTLADWALPSLLAIIIFVLGFLVVMLRDKDLIYRL